MHLSVVSSAPGLNDSSGSQRGTDQINRRSKKKSRDDRALVIAAIPIQVTVWLDWAGSESRHLRGVREGLTCRARVCVVKSHYCFVETPGLLV